MTTIQGATGDLVFFVPKTHHKKYHNLPILCGQNFLPSTSTLGAGISHVGILYSNRDKQIDEGAFLEEGCPLNAAADKTFWVFESIAICGSPQLIERDMEDSLEKYDLIVISPLPENISKQDEADLRELIKQTAINFTHSFYGDESPIPPCSRYHMMLAPAVNAVFPTANQKREIAEGVADTMLGNPRLSGCDKTGKFLHKQSFCSEFAHWVLQATFFIAQFETPGNEWIKDHIIEKVAEFRQTRRNGGDVKEIRNEIVKLIQNNFEIIFPKDSLEKIPLWLQQDSTTFNPGKLYTVLTHRAPPGKLEIVGRSILGVCSAVRTLGCETVAKTGRAASALCTKADNLRHIAFEDLCSRAGTVLTIL